MENKLPCINCIVLPICKSYAKTCKSLYFTNIFVNLAAKCSLIKEYAKPYYNSYSTYSVAKSLDVFLYLVYGIKDVDHEE